MNKTITKIKDKISTQGRTNVINEISCLYYNKFMQATFGKSCSMGGKSLGNVHNYKNYLNQL